MNRGPDYIDGDLGGFVLALIPGVWLVSKRGGVGGGLWGGLGIVGWAGKDRRGMCDRDGVWGRILDRDSCKAGERIT